MATNRLSEGVLLNDRYEVQAVLGYGGMGTVYRAVDRRLDVPVAVKEMVEHGPDTDEGREARVQFEREARLLAQLSHPNLPRVTDYFVEGDRWYLVMELIQGTTLERLQAEAGGCAMPVRSVLDWGVQLADVLAYLHSQDPPVVFRDLKPANVMVQPDGTVRLIDFGIARRFHEGAAQDTLLYGSPGYSPPEQYGRAQTGPTADIYALGATLHHLLTGRDPSTAPFKFPAVRSTDPSVPVDLDVWLGRCTEMDPERRYQSAAQARDSLVRIRLAHQAGPEPERRPAPRVVSARLQAVEERRGLRRLAGRLVIALAVLAVAAIAYVAAPRLHGPARHRTAPRLTAAYQPPVVPPASTAPASLQVTSIPAGSIAWLDGQQLGRTPQQVAPVAPGRHVLRLIPPASGAYAEAVREIDLSPGQALEVDMALAPVTPTSATAGPSAAITAGPEAQVAAGSTGGRPDAARTGVQVAFSLRVSGSAGRDGTASVLFFGANRQPLAPRDGASAYQNGQGVLASSRDFAVMADPTDYPAFTLFAPAGAFPLNALGAPLYCQVAVYVDGRQVGQSDLVAVQGALPR